MASELYKRTIMEHFRSEAYRLAVDNPSLVKEGRNPVCGDELTIYMRLEGDGIVAAGFEGNGCSISIAAADLLCGAIEGRAASEAEGLIGSYLELVREGGREPDFTDDLEDLNAMAAVREHPSRIDCAVLAWETAEEMLEEMKKDTEEKHGD